MTLTLKQLLFAVVGALSALLLFVAGMSASEALDNRDVALEVAESVSDTEMLLDSAMLLVEERDLVRVALTAPGAIHAEDIAAMQEEPGRVREGLCGVVGTYPRRRQLRRQDPDYHRDSKRRTARSRRCGARRTR